MDTDKSKSTSKYETVAWLAIGVITLAGMLGTFYYKLSTPIQSIMWVIWCVVTILLFYLTTQGKQLYEFATESKVELQKVVWPARKETVQTTLIVMAMVAITGFVLWGVDMSMMWVIGKITHLS